MGSTINRDTKKLLFEAGYKMALEKGIRSLTNKSITEATGFYRKSVDFHFGSIGAFRLAILSHGVGLGTMQPTEDTTALRKTPEQRKADILQEAYSQATIHGIAQVTRISVATKLGVTEGLINRYFSGRGGLRDAVLYQGIVNSNPDIVADAIELGMSTAHVPPPLLAAAKKILAL